MIKRMRKTFISLVLILFSLAPLFAVYDSNDSNSSLNAIFLDGKREFFRELKLEFGLHPSKFSLLPESIAKIENAENEIPFIYENLINIMYLKESPDFNTLKDRNSQESMEQFRSRFLKLSKETAVRFVESLFSNQSSLKAESGDAFSSGKNRLDLILASFQKSKSTGRFNNDRMSSEILSAAIYKMWGFKVARFRKAHRITRGEGVKIAIIDTGVREGDSLSDLGHINLESSFSLIGRKQAPWTQEKIPVLDKCGHGTVMTALLMAAAPESEIYIYKISYSSRQAYSFWPAMQAAQAIYKAVHEGMNAICLSSIFDTDFEFLKKACEYAYENNVVIVCPNGNSSGISPDKARQFPAHYLTTVAVAGIVPDATNKPVAWNRSGASHYSSIAAPATIFDFRDKKVLLSDLDIQDNSWAAALTCGLVALVSSKISKTDMDLKGQYFQRIHEIITQSANPLILGFPNFNPKVGYGLIDAEKSVNKGLETYLIKVTRIEENFKKRMAEIAKREQDTNPKKTEKK